MTRWLCMDYICSTHPPQQVRHGDFQFTESVRYPSVVIFLNLSSEPDPGNCVFSSIPLIHYHFFRLILPSNLHRQVSTCLLTLPLGCLRYSSNLVYPKLNSFVIEQQWLGDTGVIASQIIGLKVSYTQSLHLGDCLSPALHWVMLAPIGPRICSWGQKIIIQYGNRYTAYLWY